MPDYHVVSLRYTLKHKNDVTFNNPPPVEFENEDARFRLNEGVLLCELKTHYGTAEDARASIDPILQAWEIDAAVRRNLHGLKFEFVCADIIDREPAAGGNVIVGVGAASMVTVGMDAILHVGWANYPEPPQTFQVTPDVESLFLRYKRHLEGREPLLPMAYFCLTVLEANAGGREKAAPKIRRKKAAQKFRIEMSVLSTLGKLTSTRGDDLTARKRDGSAPGQPLSGAEAAWINECLRAIILQVGDTRSIDEMPELKMAELPTLPPA